MSAPSPNPKVIKAKVSLVGQGKVGKTSLIKRFVLDQFDDIYVQTLGTKIMKKEVLVPMPRPHRDALVELIVFDTMGQADFRSLLQEAYFFGARALIGVFDITRRETAENLETWIEEVRRVVGPVPATVMSNKADLLGTPGGMTREEVDHLCKLRGWTYHLTSAKTGQGVEEAFMAVAKVVANDVLAQELAAFTQQG